MSKRYNPVEHLVSVLRDGEDSCVEGVFEDCLDSFGMDRDMFFEFTGPRKSKLAKIYNEKIKCHLEEGEDFLPTIEKALSIAMTEALTVMLDTIRDENATDEEIGIACNKYFQECFADEGWDQEDQSYDWDLFVKPHLSPGEEERVYKAFGIKTF